MVQTKFTTSFIPKKPIETVAKGGVITNSGPGILTIISTTIFVVTLIAYGGFYLYKIQREAFIKEQITQLESAKNLFQEELVKNASRLDDRINGVMSLLDAHTSPSQVFGLLEKFTLKTVKFNNLNYSTQADGSIKLTGSGLARGYESIILQSDKYGESTYLRDVLFSGLQTNPQGQVTFNFQATLEAKAVNYKASLGTVSLQEAGDSFLANNQTEN
jgi:hypothetical protein